VPVSTGLTNHSAVGSSRLFAERVPGLLATPEDPHRPQSVRRHARGHSAKKVEAYIKLQKHKAADRALIALSQPYEVRYWSKKFKVTPAKLKAAVGAVGHSSKKVGEYLTGKKATKKKAAKKAVKKTARKTVKKTAKKATKKSAKKKAA
jgi:hypothetical protein